MPKRKTRKQKMISDYRRQLSLDKETVNKYTLSSKSIDEKPQIKRKIEEPVATTAYPYLKADLRKTGILTLIIIAAQFTLFFSLQKHLLMLPGLIY
ncbi:MAG TPA: hypothetical protein VFD45_00365 [Patescibacteria group bacterium]|nr:hypothetical protein [Patescibacteria group bacterium]